MTTQAGGMGHEGGKKGLPNLSPKGILGAGVEKSEGGDGKALVVGPEGQRLPVCGYHLCSVVVTLEGTPGLKSSETSVRRCVRQETPLPHPALGYSLVIWYHSPI